MEPPPNTSRNAEANGILLVMVGLSALCGAPAFGHTIAALICGFVGLIACIAGIYLLPNQVRS